MSVGSVENVPLGEEPTIGIGRPLSPDWLAHSQSIFNRVLPVDWSMQLRAIPGATYVNPEEVAKQPGVDQIADPKVIKAITGAFVGSLVADHLVDIDSLRQAQTFQATGLYFQRSKRGFTWSVRIEDKRTDDFGELPLLLAEKNILRSELDLPTPSLQNPTGSPSYRLKVGAITVGSSKANPSRLNKKAWSMIAQEVPFEPVSALDSATPEK